MSLLTVIIIFAVCILLGEISIWLAKSEIRKNCNYIDTFVNHMVGLVKNNITQKEFQAHREYILKNYKEVSNILNEDVYVCPVSEFGAALSFGNPIDPTLYTRIDSKKIEFTGQKEREIKQLNKQHFNPFILLYRGVELMTNFVIGYSIRKIDPDFDHENNKTWKAINTILTVLGSLASIYSCVKQL